MDEPPEGLEKPKMVSLFKTMNIERFSMKDALDLLSLPRTVGNDPTDDTPITAQNGRYGPYISKGKDSRSLQTEEQLLTITLEEALALLAQPRVFGRGRAAPKPPLKEFGNDPVSGNPVVAKDGKFGEYVTDGEVNAGLTKRGAKKAPAKKAAAKKSAAKKSPAKKKAAPKKAAKPKKTDE